MSGISDELKRAIATMVAAPVLLIASDFDGVLSPIVARPDDARPDPALIDLLDRLARLRSTHVAVISGRDESFLRESAGLTRIGDGLASLVGSHGASLMHGPLSHEESALLQDAEDVLGEIVARAGGERAGLLVERKSLAVALHYRLAASDVGSVAVDTALGRLGSMPLLHYLHGHKVLEFAVRKPGKGLALDHIRRRLAAQAVLFVGDDTTDEAAFAAMTHDDVSVRVAPPGVETCARFRIDSQADVRELLETVVEMRERANAEADKRRMPIERHAVLSDLRTLALVDPRSRLVWLCLPRIDSPAAFAELLGGPEHGSFDAEPPNASEFPSQQYDPGTLVLTTTWPAFTVTDYLDCSAGKPYQRAGRTDLIRRIDATAEGCVIRLRFAPRYDFGRLPTRLRLPSAGTAGGIIVEGWPDPVALVAPGVEWTLVDEGSHHAAIAIHTLAKGQSLILELRYGSASLKPSSLDEPARREQTRLFWSNWLGTLTIPPFKKELVTRSALAIRALCHAPTGAIAAAGTTSLPEHLGGVRNWDYRFCWPRDASLAAAALVRLGNTGTAIRLLDWLGHIVDTLHAPDRLRPIYRVDGTELGPEGEVGELAGWGGSKPVRVGNAAANQVQLDVFGPIVSLVAALAERGAPITPQYWRLVEAMVHAVENRWREPDHGIWEIREAPRHHVYTKVMCWMAVDRAIAIAESVHDRSPTEWTRLRETIAAEIFDRGWHSGARAFTGWYGADQIDAASLWVGLSGLLPGDDPRVIGTVDAVQRHLCDGKGVMRYHSDDGLPGVEGSFMLCTAWLVESLAYIGRTDDAKALFEHYCAAAGPLGWLAEEYDTRHGIVLGNYPQAYSHLGLINAALRLQSL